MQPDHALSLDVNCVHCFVEFNYWPEEGDGWNTPFLRHEYEIISCTPEQPDEDVIEALEELKEAYDI